jgi:acetoin:2,6-dichlorophenolindophenol oxidoreductase subunit beta
MPQLSYLNAINRTLAEAMRANPDVFILGEDVREGGPFGATRGLAEEFGELRVFDTPISEATICGMAIGAAQAGLRPIVEIMFIDFITLALDQLVNQGAKAHYMSGGQLTVPMVLRTQGGAGQRAAAQHSQSLEAWLTHVPGLKVVMPSTAHDAAGLLKSAIADANPVVFVENKALYNRRSEVPEQVEAIPFGQAAVRRSGRHATVVATSRMVPEALQAADRLAEEGVEVEVIDPRSLVPLDLDTIVESLSRTHRLVVAHEAVGSGGFGAEVIAEVQRVAFDQLDAPIERVAAPFVPIPFSPTLEDAYLPSHQQVYEAVQRTRGYEVGDAQG